jgi:hypothetical protein
MARKIKIVTVPDQVEPQILDAETGELIYGITKAEIIIQPRKKPVVKLTMIDVDLDIIGDEKQDG